MKEIEDVIWSERYRPRKVKDCILPENLKAQFQGFVDTGNVPNLLLHGTSGVGKTTVARAMLDEIGADYKVINGSLEGRRIDIFQDILDYASTVSFLGGRKYIILDEADFLNPNSVQPALRNFIQEYSKNCGFILTCNFLSKILVALQSRCTPIDFKINGPDREHMMMLFAKRCYKILKENNVDFEKDAVIKLIVKHSVPNPDWRLILGELQRYSITGKIDSGILVSFEEVTIRNLISNLKEKSFSKVRDWVGQNSDADPSEFYPSLYRLLPEYLTIAGTAELATILQQYQYESAFSANQEICMAACMAKIMAKLQNEWKPDAISKKAA